MAEFHQSFAQGAKRDRIALSLCVFLLLFVFGRCVVLLNSKPILLSPALLRSIGNCWAEGLFCWWFSSRCDPPAPYAKCRTRNSFHLITSLPNVGMSCAVGLTSFG